MATINISDLRPTGSDLFSDSEGYMNELGDSEVHTIYGGRRFPFPRFSAATTIASLLITTASPLIEATIRSRR